MLKVDCELPVSEGRTPFWRELFWAAEWFGLRSSDFESRGGRTARTR